jgi:hypothetical protein
MMKNATPNFLSALQLVGISFIASKAKKRSTLFQKIGLLFFLSATNVNAQTQVIPIYLTDPSQAQFSINGLDKLAAGVYLLEISDNNTGNKTTYKFFKE